MSSKRPHLNHAEQHLQRSAVGRDREADHRADAAYGEFANPECRRCRGRGWVKGHEPCPACIVAVWA